MYGVAIDMYIIPTGVTTYQYPRAVAIIVLKLVKHVKCFECASLLKGNSSEFVRHVEELIATWSREIELVITESEQIRREADDVGPSAELQYWINRRNKFDS